MTTTLTPIQLSVLQLDIGNNADLKAQPLTALGYAEIARLYAQPARPAFVVWRREVPFEEIAAAVHWGDLIALSELNIARFQLMMHFVGRGVNPAKEDRREFFEAIFAGSAGARTRTALEATWKKPATRGERLYATGGGTENDPGILAIMRPLTPSDVEAALFAHA